MRGDNDPLCSRSEIFSRYVSKYNMLLCGYDVSIICECFFTVRGLLNVNGFDLLK